MIFDALAVTVKHQWDDLVCLAFYLVGVSPLRVQHLDEYGVFVKR